MSRERLQEEWAPYATLLPFDTMFARIEAPRKLSPAPFEHIVPTFVLNQDGPVIAGVFLFAERTVCEVAWSKPHFQFDFAPLDPLYHYRFELWTFAVKMADESEATYEMAKIEWKHGSPLFGSTLNYAGRAREAWIEHVLGVVPVRRVAPGV